MNDSGAPDAARHVDLPTQADSDFDLGVLPANLMSQCRNLIESYHEVHGYASLPNMLWRFRLGGFIERQPELRHLLRRASTTRSAKKSNEGFVQVATTLLSLEILASSFAGWSAIFPAAGDSARDVLKRTGHGPHMPLMDFYLYPPKQISAAAVAALAPRAVVDPAGQHGGLRRSFDDKRSLQPASVGR